MKQLNRLECARATRWLMAMVVACTAVALTGCDEDENPLDNRDYTISGNASGSQMVPTVSGSGSGTISGTYDPDTKLLTYTSTWSGLTGPPTSAGFYSGTSGSSGIAIGSPWTIAAGATGSGSTSGTMTLTADQAKDLTDGKWYYSYGTAAYTGGEIRGQIAAER